MKLFICLGVLFSSVAALAGIEDQICYRLSEEQIAGKSVHVPSEVCFEHISIDPDQRSVSIYSSVNPGFFRKLNVDSMTRLNEDFYQFEGHIVAFEDRLSTCGHANVVTLKIKGNSDMFGMVNKHQLTMTVEESLTVDTCHSEPKITEYKYSL